MSKIIKLLLSNFLIISILILFIELIFGYWFQDYNFGTNMRGKRIQKIVFEHPQKKTYYLRDFYGFREDGDINQKYDASKIKIIFNGGSTGEEMFLNYEDTIVGKINYFFKKDNINIKIYNASLSGKSLKGHVNEFSYWFKNIPNFKPEVIIYYFGINDRKIKKNRWHDYELKLGLLGNIFWNITQKSFFYEKIKIIKDTYFYNEENINQYYTDDEKLLKRLSNNEFISYDDAKKKYKIENIEEKEIIDNFKFNLNALNKKIKIWKIKPIFITQITYNINGDKILYFLNEELKIFAKKNNYEIIKLDEIIKMPINKAFIDEVHTNEKGSAEISKIIYPFLKNKLKNSIN